MMLLRRRFLQLAAGAAAFPIVPRTGLAQSYPARAVRIIVPVAPGGALDITARLIGQWLSERLGQSFLIENRPGASTNIGIEAVAHAAPDGYTLLLIPASVTVNATLFEKLNFNFIRDIEPVASISRVPLVMEVNLAVPAKTVPEFITYAKANAGKVRALAMTTATRSDALPEVPPVADSVPGFEASTWQGIGAPKGTPAEIIDRLNREINAALADPGIKGHLADLGSIPAPMTPAAFEQMIVAETEKWGKVVRAANIKPE